MNGQINFLLDTNIVIGFLNGHLAIDHFFQKNLPNLQALGVSEITRMELLGFPNITANEENIIHQFLTFVKVIPLSRAVSDKAIQLRRTTRLKLPDAIIAATAIVNESILITCDSSLTNHVPELQNINPLTEAL